MLGLEIGAMNQKNAYIRAKPFEQTGQMYGLDFVSIRSRVSVVFTDI